MNALLIVLLVVVVVVIVAGLALTPMLNKRGDAAIERAHELVGGKDAVKVIEPKATGFGTEPDEAGGLRGMGVLAAGPDQIAFVTWAPQKEFSIDRGAITKVGTAADDPTAVQKTMIQITYTDPSEGEVLAQFRIGRDLGDWLDELGYDWGPEGRPAPATEDDADS
ncbi:MAG: hypothetical protein R2726_02835 [Acidimicrobiales bacterium]